MKKLIKISEDTHTRLKELADQMGLTIQEITEAFLDSGLKRNLDGETELLENKVMEVPKL